MTLLLPTFLIARTIAIGIPTNAQPAKNDFAGRPMWAVCGAGVHDAADLRGRGAAMRDNALPILMLMLFAAAGLLVWIVVSCAR